ncbi:hypothetical protein K402DRAFT_461720 [Aulographum hederae CBS 113979]|uniref:BUB protein kinase n=1 Tax=Aulographum hederae CBS 113979 TaxID=1176131 RepID=A0A6G1H6W7_9PEZI|nr:hypothetical protein K402DRAFT_461720 [Aulographum hederae CBS 113979]
MPPSPDLIDFDIIEGHKENIQSLPSGRSAKALATLYSPPLSSQQPSQNTDDSARQTFEKELLVIADSDDPLDVYDRYVKWTLDTYPSAQATPQSRLLPLLERATKEFLKSSHYKNDPRYLKIWLLYIKLFSDSPRETYAFLARHGVGDGLALFYEEFAAWLESAGRWKQAEEVFSLGVDREARPLERLLRKYGEFQHRSESRTHEADEPSSPALPTVRPALAAKMDPFSAASPRETEVDPQAGDRAAAARGGRSKQKLAIFSDGDGPTPPGSSEGPRGWDTIGSLEERKKENTREKKSWAGETLKGGGKKPNAGEKMMIFKDQSKSKFKRTVMSSAESNALANHPRTTDPRTGKISCHLVNLEAVYPNWETGDMTEEYCFEELMARRRGLLDKDWSQEDEEKPVPKQVEEAPKRPEVPRTMTQAIDAISPRRVSPRRESPQPVQPDTQEGVNSLSRNFGTKMQIHVDENNENDENAAPARKQTLEPSKAAKKARREERANRTRKIAVLEVQKETQTVQTNLASPTGPKIKRKKSAEPTMTVCTKEAMNEVYDIFNAPLPAAEEHTEAEESGDESEEDDDDDDYTSAGESTGTGRISGANSEYGEETGAGDFTEAKSMMGDETENRTNLSGGWTEFSVAEKLQDGDYDNVEKPDQTNQSSFDIYEDQEQPQSENVHEHEDLVTPTSPSMAEMALPPRYVPLPPEDYDAPIRPFRDHNQVAQNRLPFMTPIVEKTESSLGAATALAAAQKDYFTSKTPCRAVQNPKLSEFDEHEPWSSPFLDDVKENNIKNGNKVPQPALPRPDRNREPLGDLKVPLGPSQPAGINLPANFGKPKVITKGPIILDAQCNPVDEYIRETILSQIQPPLTSYEGYHEHLENRCGKSAEIRKFTKAVSKMSKNSADKTSTNLSLPPVLTFGGTDRVYTVKRELGKGAFAPVYLLESSSSASSEDTDESNQNTSVTTTRNSLEALKTEDPPSAWEFYILRQCATRLSHSSSSSRALASIITAHEMHLFADEGYLIESYRDTGTLLNLVNLARADGSAGGVLDESVVMFLAVEMLRTVEALHRNGIVHGDLKVDNVLVRLDGAGDSATSWNSQYSREGGNGWGERGVCLIDFGRGIDMRAFRPEVQFIADWKTTEADCAEMRELRPWTYQVDYHGLAGCVHTLLFGKYIETVAVVDNKSGGGDGEMGLGLGLGLGRGKQRQYKIKENFRRYWQTEIWTQLFDLLLNPLPKVEELGEEGGTLPVLKGLKGCRERMEEWLEANCERGVGLKGLLRRIEMQVGGRRK